MTDTGDTQHGYDIVADVYAERIYDELRHKPLDRAWLDRFAARVRDLGPAVDLGCGPGQVARYLRDHGVRDVLGIDLSPGMLAQARRLNPDIEFRQGDMRRLDVPDATWGGIAAFYSIIHIHRDEMLDTLRELKRVLRPHGLLLLVFHRGQETLHADELLGKTVNVDFHFFERVEMVDYLETAGFVVEDAIEREPYPDIEHQSHRVYILAYKPDERR
jgi:SAM-dependent methyltransferase